MKFKILHILLIFFILSSCKQLNTNQSIFNETIEKRFRNSGFVLIYDESLNIKMLDDRSLTIYQRNLSKKSFVKITNPINKKSLIAEVKSNKIDFSSFYNSVISKRIAETLELDINEPYVEIVLISKNSTFIAKKAKTFEEEREVAEKAPIDGIQINDLNNNDSTENDNKLFKNFSYSIKVADFYYKKTAMLMVDRIKKETLINDIKIIELSKTNYRVLIGPFNDINSLKESFEKMNSLYFENLEILKNA